MTKYHPIQQSPSMSPSGVHRWSLLELDTPTIYQQWQASNKSLSCTRGTLGLSPYSRSQTGLDGGIQPTVAWPTTDIATVRINRCRRQDRARSSPKPRDRARPRWDEWARRSRSLQHGRHHREGCTSLQPTSRCSLLRSLQHLAVKHHRKTAPLAKRVAAAAWRSPRYRHHC
jgi:hypothetical protein